MLNAELKENEVKELLIQSRCEEHDRSKTYYCKNCSKIICSKCVQNKHVDHEWEDIKEVIRCISEQANLADQVIEENEKTFDENIQLLEDFRKERIREIDLHRDTYKKKHEERKKHLEQRAELIRKCMSDLQKYHSCASDAAAGHFPGIITELEEKIENSLDSSRTESQRDITEITKKIDDTGINNRSTSSADKSSQYEINHTRTELVERNQIKVLRGKVSLTKVIDIVPMSESMAWIADGKRYVELIDLEGGILRSCETMISFDGFAFGICEVFLCNQQNRVIQPVGMSKQELNFVNNPLSVTFTRDSELIVPFLTNRINPQGVILKSVNGKLSDAGKNIIGLRIPTGGCKIHIPMRVIQHVNGDICILNRKELSTYLAQIIIIDPERKLLGIYPREDETRDIRHIAYDDLGNIICTDYTKVEISLLSGNGQHIKSLLSMTNLKITTLACFNSRVWVYSGGNLITIYDLQ